MALPQSNRPVKGDCEFCSKTEILLYSQHGDMMCEDCIARENAVINTIKTVEQIRNVDSAIEMKQDIFKAETVAFVELQAAIQNDPSIPEDKKQFAYVNAAAERIKQFDAIIFADEQALIAKRNQRYAWLAETKNAAAALKVEEREKFKQYDMNYNPNPPTKSVKSIKPAKPGSSKKMKMEKAKEMSEKYGVPVESIAIMMAQFHCNEEEAAQRYLALFPSDSKDNSNKESK